MSAEEKPTEMVLKRIKGIRGIETRIMGIVSCGGFICLAVKGEDGIWRNAQNEALHGVEVVTEF
jgi:hypothetical protein